MAVVDAMAIEVDDMVRMPTTPCFLKLFAESLQSRRRKQRQLGEGTELVEGVEE
jgi:hypothetical protein